jgi:Fe2+ transport system protein FeoA
MKRLLDVKEGCKAVVKDVDMDEALKLKLFELGILPGTELELIQVAPFGGPIKIKLHDFCLALRRTEAYKILVEEKC